MVIQFIIIELDSRRATDPHKISSAPSSTLSDSKGSRMTSLILFNGFGSAG